MANYYVRKTGHDDTGDGSTGNPWLTISKALDTIAIGGGHTVKIGDGTYAENTQGTTYFSVYRNFAAEVVFESESGIAANVIITGSAHVTYDTLCNSGGATNVHFRNVTFQQRDNSTSCAVRLRDATNLTFTGCVFSPTTSAGANPSVAIQVGGGGNASTIAFTGCTFTQTAGDCINITGQGGATTTGITFSGCTALSTGYAVRAATNIGTLTFTNGSYEGGGNYALDFVQVATLVMSGVTVIATNTAVTVATRYDPNGTVGTAVTLTNLTATGVVWVRGALNDLTITGGTFTSSGIALQIGEDGVGANQILSGEISGATVQSATSHSLLIGGGCVSLAASNVQVTGGDYAVIFKENAGGSITASNLTGGTAGGLYFKAATNAAATNNTIRSTQSPCVQLQRGDTLNKCQNVTLTNNRIFATGTGKCLNWGDNVHDLGGGVCDYNVYDPRSTGKLGAVRADADVQTLAELQAAWAGYGDGSNDTHSRLFAPDSAAVLLRVLGRL
jgi:hypothetical protein